MSDSYVTEILVARRRARLLVAAVVTLAGVLGVVSLGSLVMDALAAHAALVRIVVPGSGR